MFSDHGPPVPRFLHPPQFEASRRSGYAFPMAFRLPRSRFLRLVLLLLLLGLVAAPGIYMRMRSWPHLPTRGALLWEFGVPVDYQTCGFHTGQDWFAPVGAPIYAIQGGTVLYVGPLWLDGPGQGRGPFSIVLAHPDGSFTTYSHNSLSLVVAGQAVQRGDKIAEVGAEGFARGPHLHLEKVLAPFTGDWRQPFVGCDGYVDPGNRWSPF